MAKRWTWAAIVAGFALIGIVPSWMMGNALVRPSASAVAPAVSPARDLTLKSADGLIVAAT